MLDGRNAPPFITARANVWNEECCAYCLCIALFIGRLADPCGRGKEIHEHPSDLGTCNSGEWQDRRIGVITNKI